MLKYADLKKIGIMSSQSAVTKSLAILPFRSHQRRNSNDTVLSDGLADALAMRLLNVENLKITPSSSVRQYLSQTNDSFTLGKLLKVDCILEGYIFPSNERTRFTVQLLNVPNRSVLWAAQFDENETDVFRLEDRISERIAKATLLPTPCTWVSRRNQSRSPAVAKPRRRMSFSLTCRSVKTVQASPVSPSAARVFDEQWTR